MLITKTNSGNNEDYLLRENGQTFLKLRYKPNQHTARLETGDEKRVFIIEDEGLLRSKFVIRNEYGVRIGQLDSNNWSTNEGIIQMEGIRYKYKIQNTPQPELLIYKDSKKNIIFRCDIPGEGKPGGSSASADTTSSVISRLYPLLFSICWYLVPRIDTGIMVA